jgi:LacI family transcriptional regulator
MSVTIDDVARAAGVHPATVSRALRGVAGKVSPAKRAEIEAVARQLGYQPNIVAASLRTKRTNIAAILVPDLANPLFAPLVKGLEQELRKHEMLALITQPPEEGRERAHLVQELVMRQVSGLIILAAEDNDAMLEVAAQRKIPTVLVNRGLGERRFSSVVNDDHESVELVLAHLRSLGHERIAHIAGPGSSSTGLARKKAFIELTQQGDPDVSLIVEARAFTREEGLTAARQLFEQAGGRYSAIFASNDLLALGVLDWARETGLSVPADLSLVGHNDMPFIDIVQPPLTTVRIPLADMSRQAAQMFIDHVNSQGLATSTRMLRPTLVVRHSTAAPRMRPVGGASSA